MIEWVQKRDGRVVPFDAGKIADAIFRAAEAVGGEDRRQAEFLAGQVVHLLQQEAFAGSVPQVEQIQDLAEKVLIENGHARTAKAYILYRNRRTRIRDAKSELMDAVSEILGEAGQGYGVYSTPADKLQRIALAASEQYTLNNLLPREFAQAHQHAAIHIEHLALYSSAPDAVVVDSPSLMRRSGGIWCRQPRKLREMGSALASVVGPCQNEVASEILLADLDRAFADLATDWPREDVAAAAETAAADLLESLNVSLAKGGSEQPKLCLSIGLETRPAGLAFSGALLRALSDRDMRHGCHSTPQVILQTEAGGSKPVLLPDETIGQINGNLSLAILHPKQKPVYFASGLRLLPEMPGAIARTFVNMPRLVLEAASLTQLWAGIDATLNLAARQMAHRYEVMSALQPGDLPFVMGQGIWGALPARAQKIGPALRYGLLLLAPVGLHDALHAAKLRFGQVPELQPGRFLSLLQGIVERWRTHYALNMQLGVLPSERIAQRFLEYDRRLFPLAAELWSGVSAYQPTVGAEHFPWLAGGHFLDVTRLGDAVQPGFYSTRHHGHCCLSCGVAFSHQQESCPVCSQTQFRSIRRVYGYLQVAQEETA